MIAGKVITGAEPAMMRAQQSNRPDWQ